MVVGVLQREDKSLDPVGLSELRDKSDISKSYHTYIPDTLGRQIKILDFAYEASEYPKLEGKAFQVLFVENDPVHLPFLAIGDGEGIEAGRIYTRRGVGTEPANYDELQEIINRRLETGYSTRRELDLKIHLEQLKILYDQHSPLSTRSIFTAYINVMAGPSLQRLIAKQVPNPNYPEVGYETFVASCIDRKKLRIESELDIEDIPGPEFG